MSILHWNQVKHCVKYVKIRVLSDPYLSVYGQNCKKNTRKYRYDFSTDGKIKIILLNIKSRSAIRLTLLSLKLCKTLETVLEDVTTSGVSLILATTNWSFSRSNNCFFNQWDSNVDAWSEVNSYISQCTNNYTG